MAADKFSSLIEAMGYEPPAKGVKEIWHLTAVGFGIRIAAPTKSGLVRRTYLARFDELQPDGSYKNTKPSLGLVEDIGSGDEVLNYEAAERKARELVEAAKRRKAGGTVRLTVAAAWELLREELRSPASLDAPTYADKIEGIYERFLSHCHVDPQPELPRHPVGNHASVPRTRSRHDQRRGVRLLGLAVR